MRQQTVSVVSSAVGLFDAEPPESAEHQAWHEAEHDDLPQRLNGALISRDHDHDNTVRKLRLALHIGALFPHAVDPASLIWLTRFPEPDLRAAAHELLATLGVPLESAVVFDAARAAELDDEELAAAIGRQHLVGRAALIAEAGRRGLVEAWPVIIEAIGDVAEHNHQGHELLAHDREVLDAGVAALAAGPITDDVVACFDALLHHPCGALRARLLQCAPYDAELISGMRHVAAQGRDWQVDAALNWLRRVVG